MLIKNGLMELVNVKLDTIWLDILVEFALPLNSMIELTESVMHHAKSMKFGILPSAPADVYLDITL